MTKRAGRGKTKGTTRIEVRPIDEVPTPEADQAAPLIERKADGKVADKASAVTLAKFPRRGRYFNRKIKCLPGFRPHNEARIRYTRARVEELVQAWGGVSFAVDAMIRKAAWLWVSSEFASEKAAETGDFDLFILAKSLAGEAKILEHSAWDMAQAESVVRKAGQKHGEMSPKEQIRIEAEADARARKEREAAEAQEADGVADEEQAT